MPYQSVFRPDLFRDQIHIVTGGGTGIGRCIAHELAFLGAHVTLLGRRQEKLEATAQEILTDGGSADFHTCDIRDEERVREVVDRVISDHGTIHALVNNAGGQFPAPLAQMSTRGFEAVVRTNLTGGFLMMREVFNRGMRETGGAVVNIVADFWRGIPRMGHTGAARAGMDNLTKTAAVEWAEHGIRVNAVAPGYIASSGMDTYGPEMAPVLRALPRMVPARRMGTEAEISAAVCFLLSPAAAFITGTTLRVDGGGPLENAIWPIPDHGRSRPFEGFHRGVRPRIFEQEAEQEVDKPKPRTEPDTEAEGSEGSD